MKDNLERIEAKLDKVAADITSLKISTAVTRQKIKKVEGDADKIAELYRFKNNVIGVSKFISLCGILAAIATALKQYI